MFLKICIRQLGAEIETLGTPFIPEGGAYGRSALTHSHDLH